MVEPIGRAQSAPDTLDAFGTHLISRINHGSQPHFYGECTLAHLFGPCTCIPSLLPGTDIRHTPVRLGAGVIKSGRRWRGWPCLLLSSSLSAEVLLTKADGGEGREEEAVHLNTTHF